MAGQVVPTVVEAPPLVSAALAKKRKCGAKSLQKTGARRAWRSTSVRGHERKSVKAVAEKNEVIMLEQFIASGVVEKNEVINIDSD
jgi:hypothetical protein